LSRLDFQGIWVEKANFSKEEDVLVDSEADFSKLDLEQASNLLVHWVTPMAGE
jgi:hypothetical protein